MDKTINAPLISVVMPVYNCSRFIAEAIESILYQTFTDFELIIIDDGSTDKTTELISSYTDKRIKFISKEKNSGLVDSLNIGFSLATGKYIARMDGDDVSDSTRFEKQIHLMESNPEVALCGTWIQVLGTKNVIKYPIDFDTAKFAMLESCSFGHPTVMLRSDFLRSHNLHYDPDFAWCEDYELWTRFALLGQMINLPEALLQYRIHNDQVTIKHNQLQIHNTNVCRAKMLRYPLPKINTNDILISEELVKNIRITNTLGLITSLNWLNNLLTFNQQQEFYRHEWFKEYINAKKTAIIKRFYLNEASYNPLLLIRFWVHRQYFKNQFTFTERCKLYAKCLICYK